MKRILKYWVAIPQREAPVSCLRGREEHQVRHEHTLRIEIAVIDLFWMKIAFDVLVEEIDIFRLVSFRLKQLSPCLILIW